MRNKATKKNMDLDLRRYGKMLYSKAEESGGSGGGGDDGGSTEIDYEAIYQFYKNKLIELFPEELIQRSIIPEHFVDIEDGVGYSEDYENKTGIWKARNIAAIENPIVLFSDVDVFNSDIIYFGTYQYSQGPVI